MRNLHLTFDCMYCSQKLGGDFAKFCGLLGIFELYLFEFFATPRICRKSTVCKIGMFDSLLRVQISVLAKVASNKTCRFNTLCLFCICEGSRKTQISTETADTDSSKCHFSCLLMLLLLRLTDMTLLL